MAAIKTFVQNMDAFFSTSHRSLNASPQRKSAKTENAGSPRSSSAAPVATQDWVKTGLAAALGAMGEAVDSRLQVTEAKLEEQAKEIREVKNELREVKAHLEKTSVSAPPQDYEKELKDLKKEVEEVTLRASKQGPNENGCTAVCGNLGYDTEPDVLEERCRDLLKDIGMQPSVLSLAAMRQGPGSACEIQFDASENLMKARLLVQARRLRFGDGRVVWLDHKKPKDAFRTNRLCHRIADYLEMVEAEKTEGAHKVEKNIKMKSVKVNGSVVGFPKAGEWSWTPAASTLYTLEVQEMAKSFAEDA